MSALYTFPYDGRPVMPLSRRYFATHAFVSCRVFSIAAAFSGGVPRELQGELDLVDHRRRLLRVHRLLVRAEAEEREGLGVGAEGRGVCLMR